MSHFYFLVSKKIQEYIPTAMLLYLQTAQLILYMAMTITLFEYLSSPVISQALANNLLKSFFLVLLITRAFNIICRNKILAAVPLIKKTFKEKDRLLLIDEIEESLKKSLDFTKWSCGILATVLALVANVMGSFILKGLEIISSKAVTESLINDFIQENSFNIYSFIELFLGLVIFIVCIVLFYYFTLQMFTYKKRLILKILKYCAYETQINFNNYSLINVIAEIFFWDYLKKIL